MKFGIMLNHQFDRGDDLGRRLDELVQLTEAARDHGFASIVVHHHYLANLATPQPVPLLGRLIPSSGDMRLGVGVYDGAHLDAPNSLDERHHRTEQRVTH